MREHTKYKRDARVSLQAPRATSQGVCGKRRGQAAGRLALHVNYRAKHVPLKRGRATLHVKVQATARNHVLNTEKT